MITKFEFTEQHNQVFKSLTQNMVRSAIIWALLGGILLVEAVAELFLLGGLSSWGDMARILGFLIGPMVLAIAYYSYQPVDNFKAIILTKGRDMEELMIALDDLSKLFHVLRMVMGIIGITLTIRVVLYLFG
ncbi:MAG: hypothetical protein KDJ65_08045 [Anaerolineae bacterium]|nr:hypothetical protein [Anaerolineae bacterium]